LGVEKLREKALNLEEEEKILGYLYKNSLN
jgi:hypothetical protein